jgi:uncharacterized protein YdaU (DUF1376 family)
VSVAPSFQFYHRDFLTATAHMTNDVVGAYIRLLIHQWETGSVPNDRREIAEICHFKGRSSARVWCQLKDKFPLGQDGRLRNPRLEQVRTASAAFAESQRRKAAARWSHDAQGEADAGAYAGALPGHMPEPCSPISDLRSPVRTGEGSCSSQELAGTGAAELARAEKPPPFKKKNKSNKNMPEWLVRAMARQREEEPC